MDRLTSTLKIRRFDMVSNTMAGVETNDVRFIAILLDLLRQSLQEYFEHPLTTSFSYRMNQNDDDYDVMSLLVETPNPEFGRPPCCFYEPVVAVRWCDLQKSYMISIGEENFTDEKRRQKIREILDSLKPEEINFQTFSFKKIRVYDGSGIKAR
jgi:hypothetical protein